MPMTFVTSFIAPVGSQCRSARRAKPALSVGKDLVAALYVIQVGRVGCKKSPELYEGVHLQVYHD